MKKLSKTNLKSTRRRVKLSTAKENKLVSIIKKLFRVRLPKDATLEDTQNAINKIPFKKIDLYINNYINNLLKYNKEGFNAVLKSMLSGSSGSRELQKRVDESYKSLAQEKRIYYPLMQKFNNNVQLIKNIPQEVVNKLRMEYSEGTAFRGSDIEEYLESKLGKRARLIIRTESAKVNAAMTEIRAKDLGLNAYIWSTSEDRRVRPSHKIMNGVLVFWDTLLTLDNMSGHAGEYPNCRCIGLPVVSLDDIQFPVKVAEGNLTINSKYIKGTHGKGYDVEIVSGAIRVYTKQEFLKKYGQQFAA